MFYLGLIQNVALLVALAAGLHLLAQKLEDHPFLYRQVGAILFGLVGIIGMMTPVELVPGVIYDGRSIILSLAGLVCGPWALLSALIASLYRAYLGGAGTVAGIAVIVFAAGIGMALHYVRQRNAAWSQPMRLWLVGLVVNAGVIFAQYLIPGIDIKHMLIQVGPSILVFFPIAFLVAARFFIDGERRQKYERALRESDERLALSIEGADLGTWDWNIITGETVFNNRWAEMIGYRLEDIDTNVSSWEKLIHPDDRELVMRVLNDHLEGKTDGYEVEHRMRHKSGEWVWVLDKGRVIECAPDGTPLRACGTHLDVTERRRTEEALRESALQLKAAIQGGVVGLWDLNLVTGEAYISPEYKQLMGFDDDEFPSTLEAWKERVHPDDIESVLLEMQQSAEQDRQGYAEYRLCHRDGNYRWMLGRATAIKDASGQPVRLVGSNIDVTARRRAEESLRQSEERNRAMLEALPDLLFRLDRQGRFLDFHSADEARLAVPPKGIIGEKADTLLPTHLAEQMQAMIDKTLASGSMHTYDYTMEINGREEFYEARMVVCCKDEVLVIARDVTDQRQAEKSLRQWNDRYQEMIDTVIEGIGYADERRVLQFCNQAFATILEAASPDDLIGRCLVDFLPEREKEIMLKHSKRLRQGEVVRRELDICTCKGTEKTVEISAAARYNESGDFAGSFLAMSDITETRRLRELQSRAERLETAGTIAGQVAHDFNNLLAPMLAYPDFIREDLPADHPAIQYLDQIEKAAETIADINQDLLAMGRRGHYNKEVLNLNAIVRQVCSDVTDLPDAVSFNLDLAPELMSIYGGGAQIHRVISNLLHNAVDALQGAGEVTVRTENYYVDEETLVYGQVPKGEYVKLTVTDNGCGIPEDIVQKIFDPFFTSKSTSKQRGSGLGLSVVDAVIKDHDAFIDLETRTGEGTSFFVYFPVARQEDPVDVSESYVGGGEKILIVDDDPMQREVSSRLLERLGYIVTTADSGEAAVETIRHAPHDLVILDMIMPGGIDGAETFRRIREIHPDQKAVIASGYAESERVAHAQKMGVGTYVKKPFGGKTIAAVIRAELNRRVTETTA